MTICILFRYTADGGFTIWKLGTGPYILFDQLNGGGIRVNPTGAGIYQDYNAGMSINTWYIITYQYSSGALSSATVRINGLLKSIGGGSGGSPTGALTKVQNMSKDPRWGN